MPIRFVKTRDVKSPQYSTEGAAALDFFIPNDMEWESKVLYPGEAIKIPSGIKIELPSTLCLLFVNKSSIGSVGTVVGAQLVDPDYRGEIHLSLVNSAKEPMLVKSGQKVMQALLLPMVKETLMQIHDEAAFTRTQRGENGFGSTGKY